MASSPGVWFVYILRCADGAFYVGETSDVEARVSRHNLGCGCLFTARRIPVSLAYVESCPDRRTALAREKQLKGWRRAKQEALIAGDLDRLRRC